MTFRTTLMAGIGLIAGTCLLPLAPAIAQTYPAPPMGTQAPASGYAAPGTSYSGQAPASPNDSAENTAGRGPAQIMRVQQDLDADGASLAVDGVMGPGTVAALRNYQQQHGLPPTGQIDGQTFTSLESTAARNEEASAGATPGMARPAPQTTLGAPQQ